jgi:hypothetical protein
MGSRQILNASDKDVEIAAMGMTQGEDVSTLSAILKGRHVGQAIAQESRHGAAPSADFNRCGIGTEGVPQQ